MDSGWRVHETLPYPHGYSWPSEPTDDAGASQLRRLLASEGLATQRIERILSTLAPTRTEDRRDDRYEFRRVLGRGGMGQVDAVWDRSLDRIVARKRLHPELCRDTLLREAFRREACVLGRLSHPAVVPVFDIGEIDDDLQTPYFTMQLVSGRTFDAWLRTYRRGDADRRSDRLPSVRRAVTLLVPALEALAEAHGEGILHRDVKPANLVLDNDTLYLMDWGLARTADGATRRAGPRPPNSDWRLGESQDTRMGAVKGTIGYLSPEAARGAWDEVGCPSDVYSAGCVLYEVVYGARAWTGDPRDILDAVRAGEQPVSPSLAGELEELARITLDAMHPDPSARTSSARVLVTALRDWLEGVGRSARARAWVTRAREHEANESTLRADAACKRGRAQAILADLPATAPEGARRAAWSMEDEAAEAERDAGVETARVELALRMALIQDADHDDALDALADRYRSAVEAAEDRGDAPAAARNTELLRQVDRGRHAAWLRGHGTAHFAVPDGWSAEVLRFELRHRRLVPEPIGLRIGAGAHTLDLRAGSYVLALEHPTQSDYRYPFVVRRLRDSHVRGPAESHDRVLPSDTGADPTRDVVVAAGWSWVGGDDKAYGRPLPRARIFVEGFVARRTPVRVRDYIAFLDDLVARGDEALALEHVPRERGVNGAASGPPIFGRGDDGRFRVQPDADGDLWDMDWPIIMVGWEAACAFAAWESARTGQAWRLPYELEYERLMRGADGRVFPMGPFLDRAWACTRGSRPGSELGPAPVGSYPEDRSPFGATDGAGGVCEWMLDEWRDEGPTITPSGAWRPAPGRSDMRTLKGGAWDSGEGRARVAYRAEAHVSVRSAIVGFRLVRPLRG